ncbi:MAG TPA: tetratricopeptide repeat protein [Clostridiaceae bacterium]|nr:tetratricopeptide repeat protein [Clostridiaceae bacterium]HHV99105.1 tetratricopeptide repeat protein [Clostridiaceae bacterium]
MINYNYYEEAILAFEKAIQIKPKSIEARLGLSKAYQAISQPDKAELVLNEALEIDPKKEDIEDIYVALFDLYIYR